VRAFVGFNQGEDLRSFGERHCGGVGFADRGKWLTVGHESQPIRGVQAGGLALQSSERCKVIGFSGHGMFLWTFRDGPLAMKRSRGW
jgi:hypothetical protein